MEVLTQACGQVEQQEFGAQAEAVGEVVAEVEQPVGLPGAQIEEAEQVSGAPTSAERAKAEVARSIVPGAAHWDVKAKDWHKDKVKPDANALKVELERRIGKAQYGRKF